jgi:hypothetical protein
MGTQVTERFTERDKTSRYLTSPFASDPNLKAFHCRLSSCKKDVGLTDGVRLYVAGMVIAHRVTFTCAHCGFESVWRPVLKPVAGHLSK